MGKTLYCRITKGLRCDAEENGKCTSGRSPCPYQALTPPYTPPASVRTKTTNKSDRCCYCSHEKVCGLKAKYKQICEQNYPAVTHCENYNQINIFTLDPL